MSWSPKKFETSPFERFYACCAAFRWFYATTLCAKNVES